ncbi:MAG: hypothetical protein ACXVAN_08535 [Polyangia bacterium]
MPLDDQRVAERVDLDLGRIDPRQLDFEHVLIAIGAQVGDDADRASGGRRSALGLE